jgi:hypothetical protein
MKKYLLICAAALSTSFVKAQDVIVPETATETFNIYYNGLNAENVVWTQTDLGFEVKYDFNYKTRITKFNDEGSFVENWIFMDLNRLDDDVSEYLTANYPSAEIVQGYELSSNTAPARAIVDVTIDGQNYRLRFRPNGEFYIKEKN